MTGRSRFPLLQIILGNAFLMSALYLTSGLLLDAARRLTGAAWLERLVRRLDDLPGTVLGALGLLAPLRRAYAYEAVGEKTLRVVFAGTTVGVIFLLAFVVGGVLALFRTLALMRGRPG